MKLRIRSSSPLAVRRSLTLGALALLLAGCGERDVAQPSQDAPIDSAAMVPGAGAGSGAAVSSAEEQPGGGVLPNPCALLTTAEMAPFIDAGSQPAEVDLGNPGIRQCDVTGSAKGMSIQLQALPDLARVTAGADAVAAFEAAGTEVAVTYLDDNATVLFAAADAGEYVVVLTTWDRLGKGSPEEQALVELAAIAAARAVDG